MSNEWPKARRGKKYNGEKGRGKDEERKRTERAASRRSDKRGKNAGENKRCQIQEGKKEVKRDEQKATSTRPVWTDATTVQVELAHRFQLRH